VLHGAHRHRRVTMATVTCGGCVYGSSVDCPADSLADSLADFIPTDPVSSS